MNNLCCVLRKDALIFWMNKTFEKNFLLKCFNHITKSQLFVKHKKEIVSINRMYYFYGAPKRTIRF